MDTQAKIIDATEVLGCISSDETEQIAHIEWRGLDVVVRRRLSFVRMMGMVNNIVQSCFDINDGTYLPEVCDFVFRCAVIDSYTNIVLPDDNEDKYKIVYDTDICAVVATAIDDDQLRMISDSVEQKVDYLVESTTQHMRRDIEKAYEALEDILHKISGAFDWIDKDTMVSLVNALGESKFDEEKLIDAIISRTSHEDSNSPNDDLIKDSDA